MSRPLCWIILCLLLSPFPASPSAAQTLVAQTSATPASATPLDDLYDFDFILPVQAPRGHVSLTGEFSGRHLVLHADILSGWYLYSATQPSGTLPSEFKFESPELKLLEIRPTTVPRLNRSPYFDVELEEHENSVTWIFTFENELPADAALKGTLDGQVCQDDGLCIPISLPFEAQYNDHLDVDALFKQAEGVADRFVFRAGEVAEKPETLTPQETVNVTSLWWALLFAFGGGIILNIMPCVLPVIGLKILSFFEQAGKDRARAFILNAWYSLGILSVFLFLAFLSLGLSILFTFDLFGILMACIVFVMALSLMDVWTLNAPGALGGKTSEKLTKQEGAVGAFFKGIITTLLAIPCGAPLLSPAVNWADMQIRAGNTPEVFLMYSVIGLGMASPYLLLGAFPEWLRFLPKPGAWMETFTKTMGFCLLLAVVWILYFVPVEKVLPTVALLFALWFVCWLFGEQQRAARMKKRSYIISPMVLGLVILFSYQIPGVSNPYTLESAMRTRIYGHEGEHWKPYSAAALESALASGKIVIVEFTADWCVNCKVLEAWVLQSETILTLLDEKGIVSLQADCTREGEAKDLLLELGSFQVPTLAIFDPADPGNPTVIRGFYTPNSLAELLR